MITTNNTTGVHPIVYLAGTICRGLGEAGVGYGSLLMLPMVPLTSFLTSQFLISLFQNNKFINFTLSNVNMLRK